MLNDQVFKMKQTVEDIQKIASIVLEENRNYKKNIEKRDSSNKWIIKRIEKNISNLKNIIDDAKWFLKRSNIENLNNEYSELMTRIWPMKMYSFNAGFRILWNTIKYSIELDLNGAIHLNTQHELDLYFNKTDPMILIDFIPDIANRVNEKMLSVINQVPSFQTKKNVFDTVIKLSEEKNYISSNILIMILIESLTKDFLKAVYKVQNPNLNEEEAEKEIYYKHNSLNDLINKIKLKEDYPITYGEVQAHYQGSTHHIIIKANNNYRENLKMRRDSIGYSQKIVHPNFKEEDLIHDITKPFYIPITVCLEFLQRKMYNDRNQIVHGLFDKIEPWKHYLYLNGLYKLFCVVEDYYAKRKVS